MDSINFKQVRIAVLGVFLFLVMVLVWYLNTDYFIKYDYLKFKEKQFNSTLHKKYDSHYITKEIMLYKGTKLIVRKELFDKLQIGDTIIKQAECDSVYFYTSEGIIIVDYNRFKRNKYLNSLDD